MDDKILVTRSTMPPYEEYIEMIRVLWDTHWLTNMGEHHNRLKEKLKEYLGVPGLSLMVNGHLALELAIQAFDFPENAEVITTPYTFISTTHAIIRNHLKPVFCDIKLSDFTIDERKIRDLITEKTVAIIPVHVYGNVCAVEEIQKIASEYNLKIIYDAAHAFGVKYKGIGIGNFGDASIFSFHATKVFHTIEGGAVTFKDNYLSERLYNLKNFGIRSEELITDVGTNAKMNEFSAIMGLCNLGHIEETINKRKLHFEHYLKRLSKVSGIRLIKPAEDIEYNFSYLPILVDSSQYKYNRDELYDYLKSNNIYTRKYFYPITSDNVCFKNKYKNASLHNARHVSDHILTLPLYDEMTLEMIDKISDLIEQV